MASLLHRDMVAKKTPTSPCDWPEDALHPIRRSSGCRDSCILTPKLVNCDSYLGMKPHTPKCSKYHKTQEPFCLLTQVPTNTLLCALSPWLPTESRVQFKVSVLTFKVLHGIGPSHQRDCFFLSHLGPPQQVPFLQNNRTVNQQGEAPQCKRQRLASPTQEEESELERSMEGGRERNI